MTAPVLLVFYSPQPDARERAAGRRPRDAVRASSRAGSSSGSSTSTPPRRSRRRCRSRRSRSSWPSSTAGRCRCSRTSLAARGAAHRADPGDAAADHAGHHRPAPAAPGARPRRGTSGRGRAAGRPALRRRPGRARRGRHRAGASRSTRSSSTPTPPTPRPPPGWRWPRLLQRTQGVDLDQARAAAAARPDDVDAQTMVADLDMLGGHVDGRLRPAHRAWSAARPATSATRPASTCSGLFGAVGNDDPRVLKARQGLASALF